MVLLTPGPCQTSEAVRQASALPDLNHRDPEFLAIKGRIDQKLTEITQESTGEAFTPYLLGGSGTAAMEAMVTSCAPRTETSLILANGYYSERQAELFQIHHLPHRVVDFGWLSGYDLGQVRSELENGVKAVFATHHETTTGRLNDIDRLAQLCQDFEVPLFVDAMSSFGADPIFAGVSGFCSAANKCLHGLPGVSFVMLSQTAIEAMASSEPLSYYLHLPRYGGKHPPLTPPVPALRAFDQALAEYPSVAQRRESYLAKVDVMEAALDKVGVERLLAKEDRSSALLVARVPFGMTYEGWFEANYQAGFVIYGCKGQLAKDWFQVSPMGETTMEDVEAWAQFVMSQK